MSSPFPLLDLPEELRGRVFNLYFQEYVQLMFFRGNAGNWLEHLTPGQLLAQTFKGVVGTRPMSQYTDRTDLQPYDQDPWPIFQTSKQLSAEAQDALCRAVVRLRFRLFLHLFGADLMVGSGDKMNRLAVDISCRALRRIRSIELDMRLPKSHVTGPKSSYGSLGYDIFRSFEILAFELPNLQQLTVRVDSDLVGFSYDYWKPESWFIHMLWFVRNLCQLRFRGGCIDTEMDRSVMLSAIERVMRAHCCTQNLSDDENRRSQAVNLLPGSDRPPFDALDTKVLWRAVMSRVCEILSQDLVATTLHCRLKRLLDDDRDCSQRVKKDLLVDLESEEGAFHDDAQLQEYLGSDYTGPGWFRAAIVALEKRYDQSQSQFAG